MSVNNEPTQNKSGITVAEQQKIQEFVRELALAFRRITGRKVDHDLEGLPVDLGISNPKPTESNEDSKPEHNN
ncbi:MAG: hypothetical protein CVU39_25000 [Chloroflexi bacterium HGW-Chloroflexi-10]|nr:MAG: hypothetical protein CVU39_25000 [Chloroflexi bacterium HGW-Chloroflexi-10]